MEGVHRVGESWFLSAHRSFYIYFGNIVFLYDKKHATMQETGRYYAFVEYEDSEGVENALKVNILAYPNVLVHAHTQNWKKRGALIVLKEGNVIPSIK